MLTTTVDGLWVLQVLTGIEVLAPELGLRPHLPSVETTQMALAHPVAEELRSAGVIADGGVDDAVVEWMTVLSRRDVGLLVYAQTPDRSEDPERILLARFAQWWVVLERCGAVVRLSAAGTASTEHAAALVINAQIDRLCDRIPAAGLRPVTLDAGELTRNVRDREGLRRFLIQQRLDGDQVRALLSASEPDRCAQASIVAIQSGAREAPGRTHIEAGAVTIIDAPTGRMVAEHVRRDGRTWMIVSPGSPANIGSAVQKMLRRLPAQGDWYSYRKAV